MTFRDRIMSWISRGPSADLARRPDADPFDDDGPEIDELRD